MTINERMGFIIRALGRNNNSFAKGLGVSAVVIHNIITGRKTKPSCGLLEKILSIFDNLSADYLLRGKGEIFDRHVGKARIYTQSRSGFYKQEIPNENTLIEQSLEVLKDQLAEANNVNRQLLEIVKQYSQPK